MHSYFWLVYNLSPGDADCIPGSEPALRHPEVPAHVDVET